MRAKDLRVGFVPGLVAMLALPALMPASRVRAAQTEPRDSAAGHFREQFGARLSEVARSVDGVIGYAVLDLTSGERFELRERLEFPAASTIKLGILHELFRQADSGTLRLDETKAVDPGQVVGGTGVLKELGMPVLSLRDYATLMIVVSDNTATNVLIDRVGSDSVNRAFAGIGARQTHLRRRMMDLDAARRGEENTTTPADLSLLWEATFRGRGLSSEGRDAMIGILKKFKSSPLVRGVPAGVEVASKSGELEGVRADSGIVFARNRPYVLVVMTSLLARDEDGDRAIEDISRIAYGYFARLGASSPTGRLIDR